MSEEISTAELDFLLRFPIKPHVTSPVDFLSNTSWGGICSLAAKDEFRYESESKIKKLRINKSSCALKQRKAHPNYILFYLGAQ